MFSVCSQGEKGEEVLTPRYLPPHPGQGSTPRYLPLIQGTYPLSMSGQGEGVPQGTYPSVQGTYPPSRSGWGRGYPKVSTPLSKVPTPQGTYPPPTWDGTAYRVLDTLQSVCLLRSCRRTFLFFKYMMETLPTLYPSDLMNFTPRISNGMQKGNVFTGVCPFTGGYPSPRFFPRFLVLGPF